MAHKLAQRGSLDNEIINVFFCDGPEDLLEIPKANINLGSVAVVVEPFDMLMAKSNKEWVSITSTSSSSNNEDGE